MNNPVSSDPNHALYPWPPGCTGHRLLELIRTELPEFSREAYLGAFDRRNLIQSKEWRMAEAREAGAALRIQLVEQRAVFVALGVATASALGLDMSHGQWLPTKMGGQATWLPHPSGRNLWYNIQDNRRLAARLLAKLARSETISR